MIKLHDYILVDTADSPSARDRRGDSSVPEAPPFCQRPRRVLMLGRRAWPSRGCAALLACMGVVSFATVRHTTHHAKEIRRKRDLHLELKSSLDVAILQTSRGLATCRESVLLLRPVREVHKTGRQRRRVS
ncbi:hypothetical protein C7M84_011339 [Penaeus vannamei]|uniref:Uncharacterized protein n=1 Tax=Penaeus vannamei TaxID=6689 RepID=A0A423T1N0_PENVA|nr:hypothetical protein C7M84_011339 [Penaeus vannamei]